MLENFDKNNFFFICDFTFSCFRCHCFSNLFYQIILLLRFHNKGLIHFQTFSSQSKIRIRAFILMKCILGFVLYKWKLLNHNLEQTACRNGYSVLVRGTYFMFLRPYRIMLLLGYKQSKNFKSERISYLVRSQSLYDH